MSHPGLIVRPADRGAAHRAFVALPYRLYAGDAHWVPPLRSEDRR